MIPLPISSSLLVFFVSFLFNFQRLVQFKSYKGADLFFVAVIFVSFASIPFAPDTLELLQRTMTFTIFGAFVFKILPEQLDRHVVEFVRHAFILGVLYMIVNQYYYDQLLNYKGWFFGFLENRHNVSLLLAMYFILIVSYVLINKSFFLYVVSLPPLLIALYLIFNSYARIGLFYIFTYLAFWGLIKFWSYRVWRKVLFVIFFAAIAFFALHFFEETGYLNYALDRGLSGRDIITAALISYMLEYPYHLIMGFGAGSLEVIGHTLIDASTRDTNNVVGVVFEYGVIGLSLFLMFFFVYFAKLIKHIRCKTNNFHLMLIPLPVLLSVSEVTWINFNSIDTVIMYIFMVYTIKKLPNEGGMKLYLDASPLVYYVSKK